jgi:hypothetical protein
MEQAMFKFWLDAYGQAWQMRSAQQAGELFTDDALYYEKPFGEPLRGRAAIIEYWRGVERTQENIRFDYTVLAVTGNVGIAQWTASFNRIPLGKRVQIDGVLTATMNDTVCCTTFREWWHSQEAPGDA